MATNHGQQSRHPTPRSGRAASIQGDYPRPNSPEDHTEAQDYEYRRKLQNRLAQRRYREKLKQRLESERTKPGQLAGPEASRPSEHEQASQERGDCDGSEAMAWNPEAARPPPPPPPRGNFSPATPFDGDAYVGGRGLSDSQNVWNLCFPNTPGPLPAFHNIPLDDGFWVGQEQLDALRRPGPTSKANVESSQRLHVDGKPPPQRQEQSTEVHNPSRQRQTPPTYRPQLPNLPPIAPLGRASSIGLLGRQQGPSTVRRVRPDSGSCSTSNSSDTSGVSVYKSRLNDKASEIITELAQLYAFGVDLEMLQHDADFIEAIERVYERFVSLSLPPPNPEPGDVETSNDMEGVISQLG